MTYHFDALNVGCETVAPSSETFLADIIRHPDCSSVILPKSAADAEPAKRPIVKRKGIANAIENFLFISFPRRTTQKRNVSKHSMMSTTQVQSFLFNCSSFSPAGSRMHEINDSRRGAPPRRFMEFPSSCSIFLHSGTLANPFK